MNEAVLQKLRVIVERAVRPVQASIAQKLKMREELLAHVTAVFEEERHRGSDEASALIEVERRFGDPTELALTLQESVPKRDRFVFLFEQLIQPIAGESLVRRAARYGLLVFLFDAILSITLAVLLLPLFGKGQTLGSSSAILLVLSVSIGVMMFIATLLTVKLQQTLFGESNRSLFKASLFLIATCFVPVLLRIVFSVGMALVVFRLDSTDLGTPALISVLPAMLAAPCVLIAIAKLTSDEKQKSEMWSRLQID